MEEFIRPFDYRRMESTNDMWNQLNLNSKWSIGCVSELIQKKNWSSKEEWENFYYKSGEERNGLIGDNGAILNNFRMSYSQHNSQPSPLKAINYYHGRTKEDLMERAKVLYEAVKNNGHNLSLEECYECVRFRTICQTWNGIVVAETRCISILQKTFPNLKFEKAKGDIDYDYEVDYEVYSKDGKLLLGLQIKPSSYFGYSQYLISARAINENKFKAYREAKGVDVLIVIYNPKVYSYIVNLKEIKDYLIK